MRRSFTGGVRADWTTPTTSSSLGANDHHAEIDVFEDFQSVGSLLQGQGRLRKGLPQQSQMYQQQQHSQLYSQPPNRPPSRTLVAPLKGFQSTLSPVPSPRQTPSPPHGPKLLLKAVVTPNQGPSPPPASEAASQKSDGTGGASVDASGDGKTGIMALFSSGGHPDSVQALSTKDSRALLYKAIQRSSVSSSTSSSSSGSASAFPPAHLNPFLAQVLNPGSPQQYSPHETPRVQSPAMGTLGVIRSPRTGRSASFNQPITLVDGKLTVAGQGMPEGTGASPTESASESARAVTPVAQSIPHIALAAAPRPVSARPRPRASFVSLQEVRGSNNNSNHNNESDSDSDSEDYDDVTQLVREQGIPRILDDKSSQTIGAAPTLRAPTDPTGSLTRGPRLTREITTTAQSPAPIDDLALAVQRSHLPHPAVESAPVVEENASRSASSSSFFDNSSSSFPIDSTSATRSSTTVQAEQLEEAEGSRIPVAPSPNAVEISNREGERLNEVCDTGLHHTTIANPLPKDDDFEGPRETEVSQQVESGGPSSVFTSANSVVESRAAKLLLGKQVADSPVEGLGVRLVQAGVSENPESAVEDEKQRAELALAADLEVKRLVEAAKRRSDHYRAQNLSQRTTAHSYSTVVGSHTKSGIALGSEAELTLRPAELVPSQFAVNLAPLSISQPKGVFPLATARTTAVSSTPTDPVTLSTASSQARKATSLEQSLMNIIGGRPSAQPAVRVGESDSLPGLSFQVITQPTKLKRPQTATITRRSTSAASRTATGKQSTRQQEKTVTVEVACDKQIPSVRPLGFKKESPSVPNCCMSMALHGSNQPSKSHGKDVTHDPMHRIRAEEALLLLQAADSPRKSSQSSPSTLSAVVHAQITPTTATGLGQAPTDLQSLEIEELRALATRLALEVSVLRRNSRGRTDSEFAALEQQLNEAHQDASRLEGELSSFRQQHARLELQMRTAEDKARQLDQQLQNTYAVIEEKNQALAACESKIEAFVNELTSRVAQIADLEQACGVMKAQLTAMESQNATLQSATDSATRAAEGARAEAGRLRSSLEAAEQKSAMVEEAYERLKLEVHVLREALETKKREELSLRTELAERSDRLAALRKELLQITNSKDTILKERAALDQQLKAMKSRVDSAESSQVELLKQIDRHRRMFEQAQYEHEQELSNLRTQLNEAHNENDEYRKREAELKEKLEASEVRYGQLQEAALTRTDSERVLRGKLEASRLEIENLKSAHTAEVNKLKSVINQLSTTNHQKEAAALSDEVARLRKRNAALEQENEQLRVRAEHETKARETLETNSHVSERQSKEIIAVLSAQVNRLKSEIGKFEEERGQLLQRVAEAEERAKFAQSQVDHLSRKISESKP